MTHAPRAWAAYKTGNKGWLFSMEHAHSPWDARLPPEVDERSGDLFLFQCVSVSQLWEEHLISVVNCILKPHSMTFKSRTSKFKWPSWRSLSSKFRDQQANFGWHFLVEGTGWWNPFKVPCYSTQYLERTEGKHQDKQLRSTSDPYKGPTAIKSTSLLQKYHSWQKGKEDIELAGYKRGVYILKFLFFNSSQNVKGSIVGSSWQGGCWR